MVFDKLYMVLCLCFVTSIFSKNSLRETYENRHKINLFVEECPSKEFNGSQIPCCGFYKDDIWNNYLNKSFDEWKKEEIILIGFVSDISSNCDKMRKHNGRYLNDDFLVSHLISYMKDTTIHQDVIFKIGYRHILNKTAYPQIEKHKESIKEIFETQKARRLIGSQYRWLKFKLLCGVSQREKDSLLALEDKIPHLFRAKLGDTVSLNSIIEEFKNETKYNQKIKLIEQLSYIGSEESLKQLFLHINDSIVEIRGEYKGEYIITTILDAFSRHYPDEKLLNVEFTKMNKSKIKEGDIKIYLAKVYEWGFKKFGVKPLKLNPDEYVLKRSFPPILNK